MKIKHGVQLAGLQMPMRKALIVSDQVYKEHNHELVVTSGLDGTHSAGSYHYFGYAIDIRTRFFKDADESRTVAKKIQEKLGSGYTTLFEGDHIHIQYNCGK